MGHSDLLGHILGRRSIFDDIDEVNGYPGIGSLKGNHVLIGRLADIAAGAMFKKDSDALFKESIDLGRVR